MKLSSILDKLMLNLSNEIECKGIKFVEKTLNDLGPEMSAGRAYPRGLCG